MDEARHVAFGVEHARHFLAADPERGAVLRAAVEQRASFLADASAGSPHVEEALVVSASGGIRADRLGHGVRAVRELRLTMHRRRVGRLRQLGFDDDVAEQISALHTGNFM